MNPNDALLQVYPLKLASGQGQLTLRLRLRSERKIGDSRVGAFVTLAQYSVMLDASDSQDQNVLIAAGAYSDNLEATAAGVPKSEEQIFTATKLDFVAPTALGQGPAPLLEQHQPQKVQPPVAQNGPLAPVFTQDNHQLTGILKDKRVLKPPQTVVETYTLTVCPTAGITGIDCPTPLQTPVPLTRTIVKETFVAPPPGILTALDARPSSKRTITMPNIENAGGLPEFPSPRESDSLKAEDGLGGTTTDVGLGALPTGAPGTDGTSGTSTFNSTGLGDFNIATAGAADATATLESELSPGFGGDTDSIASDDALTFMPIATSDSSTKCDKDEPTPEPTPCDECEENQGGFWHWHPSGGDSHGDDHSDSEGHGNSWGWGGYGKDHHSPGYPQGTPSWGPKWPGFGGHHGHHFPGWSWGEGHLKFPWGHGHEEHDEDCDCKDEIPPPPPPPTEPCDPCEKLHHSSPSSADVSILPAATGTESSDFPDSIIDESGSSGSDLGVGSGLDSSSETSSDSLTSDKATTEFPPGAAASSKDSTATDTATKTKLTGSSPTSGDGAFNILEGMDTTATPSNEGKSSNSDKQEDKDKDNQDKDRDNKDKDKDNQDKDKENKDKDKENKDKDKENKDKDKENKNNDNDSPMDPSNWEDSKSGGKDDEKSDKDKPTTLATVPANAKPTTTPDNKNKGSTSTAAEAQSSGGGIPDIFAGEGKSDSSQMVAGSGAALIALAIGVFALL